MNDWMRAYMAFRVAWGQLLRDGGSFDAAGLRKAAEDRSVPATWGRLSVLAAEVLSKRVAAAPATQKVVCRE